jgi:predicted PurR-regulated permease PerM
MDRVAAFLSEKTPRRFIALAAFVGLLFLFRHLALLLVFFVTFERLLGWGARRIAARTGIGRKKAVLALVAVIAATVGVGTWLGVGKTIRTVAAVQDSFPDRLAELKENPLVAKVQEQIGGTEKIVEGIKHYAGDAISAASAIGHFFVYVLIGFILALVYTLEEEELASFWERVDTRSLFGTLGRWLGHVADSTVVTVQLQLVVAAFNAATTLPVLLILGVQHVGALMLLIFTSALVPVIGNIVSGAVLCLLAFQAKGWLGVGIFVALTFILHKVESYYLSPRLTARHVKIPGFLLIVSLLACEHLFGFTGLFLSFPILFVASRIRGEFQEEDAIVSSAGSPIVLTDSPDQLPGHHSDVYGDAEQPTGIELERARVPLDSVRPGAATDVESDVVVAPQPPPASAPSAPAPSAPATPVVSREPTDVA